MSKEKESKKKKHHDEEDEDQPQVPLTFKVANKGGVSVYGLGHYPVTLYYEQWVRLLERVDDLQEYLEAKKKKGLLKMRDDKD